MKTMRIYSLIIGIVALFNICFYYLGNGIINLSSKLPSTETINKTLVGRWSFEAKIIKHLEITLYEGEVEYFPDGRFTRYVTRKTFYGHEQFTKVKTRERNVDLLFGGTVKGTWKVGDGRYWEETVTDCKMQTNYISREGEVENNNRLNNRRSNHACMGFFPKSTTVYGSFENENQWVELKKFTKRRIVIERNIFSQNSKASLFFKRIKS